MASPTFADLLRQSGLLSDEQLDSARAESERAGRPLWDVVVEQGEAGEAEVFDAIARAAQVPRLNLRLVKVDRGATRKIEAGWAGEHGVVPLWADPHRGSLSVAVIDPTREGPTRALGARLGMEIRREVASASEVDQLIRHQFFREGLDRDPDRVNREAEAAALDASGLVEEERMSPPHGIDIGDDGLRLTDEPGLEGLLIGPARSDPPAPADPAPADPAPADPETREAADALGSPATLGSSTTGDLHEQHTVRAPVDMQPPPPAAPSTVAPPPPSSLDTMGAFDIDTTEPVEQRPPPAAPPPPPPRTPLPDLPTAADEAPPRRPPPLASPPAAPPPRMPPPRPPSPQGSSDLLEAETFVPSPPPDTAELRRGADPSFPAGFSRLPGEPTPPPMPPPSALDMASDLSLPDPAADLAPPPPPAPPPEPAIAGPTASQPFAPFARLPPDHVDDARESLGTPPQPIAPVSPPQPIAPVSPPPAAPSPAPSPALEIDIEDDDGPMQLELEDDPPAPDPLPSMPSLDLPSQEIDLVPRGASLSPSITGSAAPPEPPPRALADDDEDHVEQAALQRLWPIFEANQGTARALKAVFELCLQRGIITREEYLERLNRIPD